MLMDVIMCIIDIMGVHDYITTQNVNTFRRAS